MIVKATKIINNKVLTLNSGAEIAKVHDVIYDPRENKVKALVVDEGGWFSDAKVILISDVKNIGEDAVVIESEELIKKTSDVEQKVSNIANNNDFLTKTKIVTEDGKELGHVTDLFFDDKTGIVSQLEVSGGILENAKSGKKVIEIADIITIGHDATIVKKYTSEKFDQQSEQQGAQGTVIAVKDKAKELFDKTKEKTLDLKGKAEDSFAKIKQNVQDSEKQDNVKSKLNDVKDKVTGTVTDKKSELQGKISEDSKNAALGQYLTKHIIGQNDEILAKPGDLVTHQVLNQAEASGMLDQVLKNTSKDNSQVEPNKELQSNSNDMSANSSHKVL